MKVLVVYPSGAAEVIEDKRAFDKFYGLCVIEHPFVDKKIKLYREEDQSNSIPLNTAITYRKIKGTVVFSYEGGNIPDEIIKKLSKRFPNIKLIEKEDEKCTRTFASWLARLIKSLKSLLTGKK